MILSFRFISTTENKTQKFSFHFLSDQKKQSTLSQFWERDKNHCMITSNNNYGNEPIDNGEPVSVYDRRPSSQVILDSKDLKVWSWVSSNIFYRTGGSKWNRGLCRVESYLAADRSGTIQVKSYSSQVILKSSHIQVKS